MNSSKFLTTQHDPCSYAFVNENVKIGFLFIHNTNTKRILDVKVTSYIKGKEHSHILDERRKGLMSNRD